MGAIHSTALADHRGSADFVTTPEGFNWLYDLWMLGHDPSVPEYASWSFPSWNNPSVYPGGESDSEIKLLRRTMTAKLLLRKLARFLALSLERYILNGT